jgi:hypothetical protein
MKGLLAAVVALPLAIFACGPRGGTDVGNGATVTFDLSGYEKAPGAGQQALTLSSGVQIDDVWVAVERFQLVGGTACEDGSTTETTYDGPIIANLLDQDPGMSTPIAITPGDYCRLRLELHEVDADELPVGAPPELAGAAVLIRGKRSDGTPFIVRSRQNVEFRLDAKGDAPIVLQGDSPLIVGIELGSVIDGLNLPALAGNPVVVDENNNVERLNQLNKALRQAATLFRDGNDDGKLTPDESSDGKELAEGQL